MELFSVLGKLVLDSSEFDRAIDEAQRKADGFEMPDDQELEVTVDTDEFDQAAGAIEQRGGEMEGHLTDAFTGIKSALVATGIVAAFTTIAGTMAQMVNLTTQTADAIDKGSARLQISTGAYQRWDHALRQSGASISDLGRGMRNFQSIASAAANGELQDLHGSMEGIAEAEEDIEAGGLGVNKNAVTALQRLGISLKNTNGEWKTSEELMRESMLALADMENVDERGTLARALFGNGASSLNALLNMGREGVEDLLNEADDLGLVMSDQEIANGVALGDAMSNLSSEWEAIQTALMTDIVPVLTGAVTALTEFLSFLNPRNRETSLTATFESIRSDATATARSLESAEGEALRLVEKLVDLGDYWSLDSEGQATWDAMAARAVELFPQLSEWIDTDGKLIRGNTQDIKDNIREWTNLQRTRILDTALAAEREAIAERYTKAWRKAGEAAVAENQAEEYRLDLLNKTNAAIEKYGLELEKLPDDASVEQVLGLSTQAITMLREKRETGAVDEINTVYNKFRGPAEQAHTLRQEADALEAEANAAQDSLTEEADILERMIFGTTQNVKDARDEVQRFHKDLLDLPQSVTTKVNLLPNIVQGFTHAIGSDYIPYDNYPALLHRGEKVLTATEARQMGNGEVDYGRLEDALRGAITSGMQDATVVAVVTDRDVGRGANRYNGNELDAGRFRP